MKTRIYFYVKMLSDLGANMDQMVLSALIFTETDSSFWLSASLLLRVAGGALSSLYSGVLADRFSRRKLMVYADLLRAVAILLVIPFPHPVMICVASFLIGFFSSFFQVSFSAEVPRMFGEERVLETNALISRLSYVSMLFGFVGASLSDWIGYRLILSYDGLTYVLSAITLLCMKWDSTVVAKATVPLGSWKQLGEDLGEVKSYLRPRKALLVVFVAYLVETYGAASHNVGVPLLAAQINANQVALYQGMIWGVWAVGSILFTLVLPKVKWVRERLLLAYFVTTVLMSTGFITYFSMTAPSQILPFAFLTGLFDAGSSTIYSTLMQKCDNHIRGRVFGVSMLVNRGGFALGFVVVPLLLEKMTLPHMVGLMHGTVISVLLLSIAYLYLTNRKVLGKVSIVEASQ